MHFNLLSNIISQPIDRIAPQRWDGWKGGAGNPVVGYATPLPGLDDLSTPRKIAIVGLLALGVLLAAAFFLVYFGENDTQAVELTALVPDDADSVKSGSPPTPADGPVSGVVSAVDEIPKLRVYVAGAVRHPGVYPLETGDRLVDGVEAAGGATGDADLEAVNLAIRVEDEGYYYIPVKVPQLTANTDLETTADVSPTPQFPEAATNRPAAASPEETGEPVTSSVEPAGPVDLNTATQAELETLPSIGPARARAIVAYREENGPFAAVEEITAVSGIGQGILDNLQGLITVEESP